jgi:hypothetical protein
MRWAEDNAMPVSRVPGSHRSVVSAMRSALDAWERPDTPSGSGAEGQESPITTHTGLGIRRWRPGVLITAAVMLASAGALGVWLLGERAVKPQPPSPAPVTPSPTPTLPWQIAKGGSAGDVTGDRYLLQLAVGSAGGSPFTVSIASGSLLRIETVAKRVALAPSLEGDHVTLALLELRMHGAGEGIREVGLRSLTEGKTERVIVDGEALDVTWIGVQPREGRSGVTGHPMKPCCLSCGAITVCGDAVSGSCGRCAGQPGPIPPGS